MVKGCWQINVTYFLSGYQYENCLPQIYPETVLFVVVAENLQVSFTFSGLNPWTFMDAEIFNESDW